MIRFGTIRRSRSVTETATSTAQPSALTTASTVSAEVGETRCGECDPHGDTGDRAASCLGLSLAPQSEDDSAGHGGDRDDSPRRQETQQAEERDPEDDVADAV